MVYDGLLANGGFVTPQSGGSTENCASFRLNVANNDVSVRTMLLLSLHYLDANPPVTVHLQRSNSLSLQTCSDLRKFHWMKPINGMETQTRSHSKALFFNHTLSPNAIACSTCHVPNLGFSDGLPQSFGADVFFVTVLQSLMQQIIHGFDGMVDVIPYGVKRSVL